MVEIAVASAVTSSEASAALSPPEKFASELPSHPRAAHVDPVAESTTFFVSDVPSL